LQARHTELSVIYKGEEFSKNILKFLTDFSYKDCACGESDHIELTFVDKEGLWLNDWFPQKGDNIEVNIKVINWQGDEKEEIFSCGIFTVDDIKFSGRPIIFTLGAVSKPIVDCFSATEKTKTWKKVSIKAIAEEMTKNAGIELYYDAKNVAIEEIEQSAKTDLTFLYDICKDNGIAMKAYRQKIILFDEIKYEQKEAIATWKEQDFISWSGNTTIDGTYDGVLLSYQSSQKKQPIIYEFKVREGNRILKINESVENIAEAEQKAKAKLREANKTETTLSITKKGDISIVASSCVIVIGLGHFDGKYYIDDVIHNLSNGFTTKCELHRVLEGGY